MWLPSIKVPVFAGNAPERVAECGVGECAVSALRVRSLRPASADSQDTVSVGLVPDVVYMPDALLPTCAKHAAKMNLKSIKCT